MPFLVDSVTMELNRHELSTHLIVHPQLQGLPRRDRPPAGVGDGDGLVLEESWIHIEIDRQTDPYGAPGAGEGPPARPQRRARGGRGRGQDAVPGPGDRHGPAKNTGRRCRARRPATAWSCSTGWPTTTSPSSATGSTAWRPARTASCSAPCPAPAWASCAPTSRSRPASPRCPPRCAPRPTSRRLLVLTKANSRATVHRPAYLDYVGVKRFGGDGEVVGERRFLGLFTHTAYSESIEHIPVLNHKLAGGPGARRAGRRQLRRQGPHRDPGDLPARRPVPDLGRRAVPDRDGRAAAARAQAAAGCSSARTTTAATCRAWSSCRATATPPRSGCASRRSCASAFDGTSARLQRDGRRVRAGPAARRRPRRARPARCPTTSTWASWRRGSAAPPAPGRTTWPTAIVEQCGEEEAAALTRRYADAFPEGYKADFPARTAVRGPASAWSR